MVKTRENCLLVPVPVLVKNSGPVIQCLQDLISLYGDRDGQEDTGCQSQVTQTLCQVVECRGEGGVAQGDRGHHHLAGNNSVSSFAKLPSHLGHKKHEVCKAEGS